MYLETDIEKDFSSIKKVYDFVVDFLLEIKMKKIIETENNIVVALKKLREYGDDFQHKIVNKKTDKNIIILDNQNLNIKLENKIKELREFYLFDTIKR